MDLTLDQALSEYRVVEPGRNLEAGRPVDIVNIIEEYLGHEKSFTYGVLYRRPDKELPHSIPVKVGRLIRETVIRDLAGVATVGGDFPFFQRSCYVSGILPHQEFSE